ncbi:C40 family peptidase [Streptomyces sp. NPDC021354]|uniref:C40 family peptidase n=1 Tax=Streptomyces sp. NPDC021354 TaxID=3154793 RepID=UPI0034001C8A
MQLNNQAQQKAATCTGADTTQTVDASAITAQVQAVLARSGKTGTTGSIAGLEEPAEQIPNAQTIQKEGQAMNVPARGRVIAIATALQESRLRNLDHGDRDSIGLFQQRPSQGWGTPRQLQDPRYAARKFYARLLKVDGWQQMPLTQAAQKVQKSGYPDAYAQWEPLATALQQALAAPDQSTPAAQKPDAAQIAALLGLKTCGSPDTSDGTEFGTIPAGSLPEGYQIPADAPEQVRTALRWALGQLGTPYQWGGTCTNPRGRDRNGRCDCSSLMQRAYGVAGVKLTRTTYTQVSDGRGVRADELRPGDLLFTHRGVGGRPEHVGMYMGQGLIVHAPKTGDVVRVTKLVGWRQDILAVRRIVG